MQINIHLICHHVTTMHVMQYTCMSTAASAAVAATAPADLQPPGAESEQM